MKNKFLYIQYLILALLFLDLVDICITVKTGKSKKSVDDNLEENGEPGEDGKDDGMEIAEPEPANVTCTRRQNAQMHEIRPASYKQFPFIVSIMSQQNQHLCSGAIISHGLILTTAQCVEKAVNYVLLNATSDKKDSNTISLHIIKTDKFPSHSGSESIKNVAIIYTEKHNKSIASKINLSNVTNSKGDIGLEAVGFGLNSDIGQPKELQFIGLEVRSTEGDITKAYIDCIDTKVPTCFKDTGGPVIYDNQLFGIVTAGTKACTKEMSNDYAVHKWVVDVLPTYTFKKWLDDKIIKNEEQEPVALETYPSVPSFRRTAHTMKSGGGHLLNNLPSYALIPMTIIMTIA